MAATTASSLRLAPASSFLAGGSSDVLSSKSSVSVKSAVPVKKLGVVASSKKTSMAATVGIEKEVPLDEAPLSLLREGEKRDWNKPETANMRQRFESLVLSAQNSICKAIEEIDGKKFREDAWMR